VKLREFLSWAEEELGWTAIHELFVYIPYQSCHKRRNCLQLWQGRCASAMCAGCCRSILCGSLRCRCHLARTEGVGRDIRSSCLLVLGELQL
jgi:hypothetical protein